MSEEEIKKYREAQITLIEGFEKMSNAFLQIAKSVMELYAALPEEFKKEAALRQVREDSEGEPTAEDHLIDMKDDDFEMLHFCGKEGESCEVFVDLKSKYEANHGKCPFAVGSYGGIRYKDGLIEYTLRER